MTSAAVLTPISTGLEAQDRHPSLFVRALRRRECVSRRMDGSPMTVPRMRMAQVEMKTGEHE